MTWLQIIFLKACISHALLSSQCDYIMLLTYLKKNYTFIGAMDKWPAMQKWTNEYLTSTYGKNKVRVAFAPNAEYEGCEKASDFEDFRYFKFPDSVKEQLPFPDLVVVRPAFMNLKFAEFMSLLEKTRQTSQGENVSAYLEYSSIPSHLPELEKDVIEMPFAAGILKRRHLNIWLSNGKTLGKLHFDPFDNFLCQVFFSYSLDYPFVCLYSPESFPVERCCLNIGK